jgi:hypothetical protein
MNSIQRQAAYRVAKNLLLITAVIAGMLLIINVLGPQITGILFVFGLLIFLVKMMYDNEVCRIDLEERLKKHVDKTEV